MGFRRGGGEVIAEREVCDHAGQRRRIRRVRAWLIAFAAGGMVWGVGCLALMVAMGGIG